MEEDTKTQRILKYMREEHNYAMNHRGETQDQLKEQEARSKQRLGLLEYLEEHLELMEAIRK